VGHVFHDLNIACIFRVDERPDVKAAHAGMAVVAGTGVVLVNDVAESNKKCRKLRRLDSAILYERDGFALTFHAEQQAKAGFPYFPDTDLLRWIERADVGVSGVPALERGFHRVKFRAELFFVFSVELDQKKRGGISFDEPHQS